MRAAIAALAAALISGAASTADAQVVLGRGPLGGTSYFAGPGGGLGSAAPVGYGPAAPASYGPAAGAATAFVPTYSYYAASPFPARGYVGLGNDAFAFYGGPPYGHPYDKWSWAYLGGYYNALNRYFYPPLR